MSILSDWQADANKMAPTWLPVFYRPRVLLKRGRFSPWVFFPAIGVWLTKSGAFSLFNQIAVGEDWIERGPPEYRRAIVAHECGHLAGFHSAIWIALILAVFRFHLLQAPIAFIVPLATHTLGVWGGLLAGLGVIGGAIAAILMTMHWFEYQADDYAVRKVGLETMIATLHWVRNDLLPGKRAPWIEKRIRRLAARRGDGCEA